MTTRSMTAVACLLAFAAMMSASAPRAARADPVEGKAALCGACHGGNGVPANKAIPILWGQNEGYIYLQLRDYKLGNRKNPSMSAIARGLEKPDMQALAAYFADKPWGNLQQPRATSDAAHRAESINDSGGCKGCHLDAWQGDSATPRVGGQSLPYLRQTMLQFRNGERANNPWMTALLKTYTDEDIDALASYLAGL